MDNINQSRLVMIQYGLKLYNLAVKQDYILITRHQECFDIIWDCQCALMEFNEYVSIGFEEKKRLEESQSLRWSYAHQLITVVKMAVLLKQEGFSHITENDLNKIVLI